jgi:hypothetical protein
MEGLYQKAEKKRNSCRVQELRSLAWKYEGDHLGEEVETEEE